MKLPEYFTLADWDAGERYAGIPDAPDRYRRGHITMGCDVGRSLAIQNRRARKKLCVNEAFFMVEIYPRLSLDWGQAKELATSFSLVAHRNRILGDAGFVRYADGSGRSSVVHPKHEPDKIAQCQGPLAARLVPL